MVSSRSLQADNDDEEVLIQADGYPNVRVARPPGRLTGLVKIAGVDSTFLTLQVLTSLKYHLPFDHYFLKKTRGLHMKDTRVSTDIPHLFY